MKKKTVVVHSGGMDSSICLKIAIDRYGAENVLSFGFAYGQRHSEELIRAEVIAKYFKVERVVVDLSCLNEVTDNALINKSVDIEYGENKEPNTLVSGRNGLMARVAAIHADHIGAESIYMGVIEVEEANSGYRDCSRKYMDIVQAALRLDFDKPQFSILTPLVFMTKKETMKAIDQDDLKFLLEKTITCYEGIPELGCQECPACELRNQGLRDYLSEYPNFDFSYKSSLIS